MVLTDCSLKNTSELLNFLLPETTLGGGVACLTAVIALAKHALLVIVSPAKFLVIFRVLLAGIIVTS